MGSGLIPGKSGICGKLGGSEGENGISIGTPGLGDGGGTNAGFPGGGVGGASGGPGGGSEGGVAGGKKGGKEGTGVAGGEEGGCGGSGGPAGGVVALTAPPPCVALVTQFTATSEKITTPVNHQHACVMQVQARRRRSSSFSPSLLLHRKDHAPTVPSVVLAEAPGFCISKRVS